MVSLPLGRPFLGTEASRDEDRDFARFLQVSGKPLRPHWRHQGEPPQPQKRAGSAGAFAPSVRAHAETVLRAFFTRSILRRAGVLR